MVKSRPLAGIEAASAFTMQTRHTAGQTSTDGNNAAPRLSRIAASACSAESSGRAASLRSGSRQKRLPRRLRSRHGIRRGRSTADGAPVRPPPRYDRPKSAPRQSPPRLRRPRPMPHEDGTKRRGRPEGRPRRRRKNRGVRSKYPESRNESCRREPPRPPDRPSSCPEALWRSAYR